MVGFPRKRYRRYGAIHRRVQRLFRSYTFPELEVAQRHIDWLKTELFAADRERALADLREFGAQLDSEA